jgi:hypothetical protein
MSGRKLAQIGIMLVGALLLLLVVLSAGMAISGEGYASSPFLSVVMLLMIVSFIAELVVSALRGRRFKKEAKAGYTTSTRRYLDVPEVDPETGCVVRLAGESPLTPALHEERMRLIREFLAGEDVRENGR